MAVVPRSLFSVLLCSALLLVHLQADFAQAKPYGDDNNDIYSNDDYEDSEPVQSGDEEKENKEMPTFLSESKSILVNEGGQIKLDCQLSQKFGFVVMWLKNVNKTDEYLTVDKQVFKHDDRIKLQKLDQGNSLIIDDAKEEDAGNYTCKISSYKPAFQQHQIKIRVRPEVVPVPESGLIVAQTGESVTLACDVRRGKPTPVVSWHRKERKMPNGDDEMQGESFTYTSVTRHHSGYYVCSADNGFGEPTEALLKLDVQHAPEIEQDETFIHTGAGDETEVICVVHSSPKADVEWFKDGERLDGTMHVIQQRGNRHTLMVTAVDEGSFGDYTCKAKNKLGEDEKTTTVSGMAGDVTFMSAPKGSDAAQYQLQWQGLSSTPISHFRVQYRPEDAAGGADADRADDADAGGPWMESEVAASNLDREFYTGELTIPNLKPATVYLAKVASKNAYGYNEFGRSFKFATKGADPVQKPITGSASSLVPAALASIAVALFCTLTSPAQVRLL